jgi:zinc D-Ala-D-Ala carboxypeptidase
MPEKRKHLTNDFYQDEFDCNCGCGLNNIKPELVELLQRVREKYGLSMPITSGSRCKAHNKREGGKPTSDHLKGMAADVACTNAVNRRALIEAAIWAGVPVLGISKSFIHLSIGSPARVYTYD